MDLRPLIAPLTAAGRALLNLRQEHLKAFSEAIPLIVWFVIEATGLITFLALAVVHAWIVLQYILSR